MNRLESCLKSLRIQNRKALAAYIVSGDPHPDLTLSAMNALVTAGADIIELGIPFSDPMAEGPVIARGHERALTQGTSLRQTLALVKEFRRSDDSTPVVLMGYTNPIERMGYEAFVDAAAAAGVDGVLTVDLPPEEAEELNRRLKASAIEMIFLLAPTSSNERIGQVAAMAGGFIYYVSLKGVTGAGHLDTESVRLRVESIRQHSSLPVMVGFGIKDAESARTIARHADGVVVGSALVELMGKGDSHAVMLAALKNKVSSIRDALDELAP